MDQTGFSITLHHYHNHCPYHRTQDYHNPRVWLGGAVSKNNNSQTWSSQAAPTITPEKVEMKKNVDEAESIIGKFQDLRTYSLQIIQHTSQQVPGFSDV